MTDNRHSSPPPIVYGPAALELERTDGWRDLPPPKAGEYLVLAEIDIHDDGNPKRVRRIADWDGRVWNLGGYFQPVKWAEMPLIIQR